MKTLSFLFFHYFGIVLFWSSTPHGQQSIKGSSIPTSSMASPVTSVGIGMQTIQNRSSASHAHLQNPSPAHVSIHTWYNLRKNNGTLITTSVHQTNHNEIS